MHTRKKSTLFRRQEYLPLTAIITSAVLACICQSILDNEFLTLALFALVILSFAFGIWIQQTATSTTSSEEKQDLYGSKTF
jgi:hypothetical protein